VFTGGQEVEETTEDVHREDVHGEIRGAKRLRGHSQGDHEIGEIEFFTGR
jgi:hypothetical protein